MAPRRQAEEFRDHLWEHHGAKARQKQYLSVVTEKSAITSLAEAIEVLDAAALTRMVCLGAEGFWLIDGGVKPSLEHILDLSDVAPRNPRTNASIAKAEIETWPSDPAEFGIELVMISTAHPCPCCGHLTFDEEPGSYSICHVCGWEDDASQLRWPTTEGGANSMSLVAAQELFSAGNRLFAPQPNEPREAGWRAIDLAHDCFESPDNWSAEWPENLVDLYWWRPTFWRPTGGRRQE